MALLLAFSILVLWPVDPGHSREKLALSLPKGKNPGGGGAEVDRRLRGGDSASGAQASESADPRLKTAYRFEEGGWIYVHLEGSPGQVGFQHGYLLAPEIADAFAVIKLVDTHDTRRIGIFSAKPRARCFGRRSTRNTERNSWESPKG